MEINLHINKADLATMDKLARIAFINSLSGFKSLNLIGTVDENGNENVAIFNSVVHIGADPALMGLVCRPDVVDRNTLANIRANKYFTINHVNIDMVNMAHQTSARYPKGRSEFEAVGLTPYYRTNCIAPFVKESVVQIALCLEEEYTIKKNNTHLIIGEIMDIYIPEEIVVEDGCLDLELARTVCGSSLNGYHDTTLIKRLKYAKVKD